MFLVQLNAQQKLFAQTLIEKPKSLKAPVDQHRLSTDLDEIEVEQDLPPSVLKLNFNFQDERFFSSSSSLNGYNDFQEIQARLQAHVEGHVFHVGLDLGATAALNVPGYNSYYIPEAYIAHHDADYEISFGRRKQIWSELESYWELGLWQPQYKWNYFNPLEQGLTGLFAQIHDQKFSLLFFASPLYIPEQGAPYSLSKGTIQSQSPWFIPPAKSVQLFSGRANIYYNIKMPDVSEIISQFSTGMSFNYNPTPYFIRASYIYKPRNAIALPVDGYLALHSQGSEAPVTIYPKVLHHQLAGLDMGYQSKLWRIWISGVYEAILGQDYDPSLTYQKIDNQTLLSPAVEFALSENPYSPKFGLSYLKQWGGDVTDIGTLASSGTSIFAYPMNYREAAMLNYKQVFMKGKAHGNLDINLKWIEELHDSSSQLIVEFNYAPIDLISVYFGGDFVGSRAAQNSPGFLARYRDNSLVYGGIGCTF